MYLISLSAYFKFLLLDYILDADNEYRVLDPEAVKREAELSALYATPNKDRKRQVIYEMSSKV